jgi:hypothetical protein
MKLALSMWLCLAASALAQAPPPASVASEWDVRKLLERLDVQAQHLKAIVEQIQPETWVAKGAPATYQIQLKAGRAELTYFLSSDEALAKQPERLTLALDTYFRMQAMESTLGSLMEGARKYQSPALARQMQTVMSENGTNRDRLRQYVQDLAAQNEQEFKIADNEAQSCRAALVRQTPPRTRRTARP